MASANYKIKAEDKQGLPVYSRNWPMRAQWAPFCNFRRPFFKKGGPRKELLRRPGLK